MWANPYREQRKRDQSGWVCLFKKDMQKLGKYNGS